MWRKTERDLLKINNSVMVAGSFSYYCKACDEEVSQTSIYTHQNEEQHKRNLETYCDICQVKSPSTEAYSTHKALLSHKILRDRFSLRDNYLSASEVLVPIETKDFPRLVKKSKSDETPNVSSTFPCENCGKHFDSEKQLLSHEKTFPHIGIENLKMHYESDMINRFYSITNDYTIECLSCKVKMKSINDINFHVNSAKHLKKLNQFKEQVYAEDNIKIDGNASKETVNSNEHNQEEFTENIREKSLYCFICNIEFNTKSELSVHALSFPHVDLAKLKSETVSLGAPYAEYWVQIDDYFCCTLCDAKFHSTNTSKQHFQSAKHKERLIQWCKEFSTWKCGPVVDPKYFYCKICDIPLVGTTEAELHYSLKSHLGREKLYCHICCKANTTEEMFLEHNHSASHQEKAVEVTDLNSEDNSKSNENVFEVIKLEDTMTSNNLSDDSIKQEIYKEVQKLFNNVYYSKSLPYDRVLEYLKKINNDVNDLKAKYLNKEHNENNINYDNFNMNKLNINDTSDITDIKQSLINSEDGNATQISPRVRKRRKKKSILSDNLDEDTLHSTKQESTFGETEVVLNKKVKNLQDVNYENIDELLNIILFRKKEIGITTENDEMMVLNELENLINFVKQSNIPPQVVLSYLQKCNAEVESMVVDNNQKVI